MTITELNFKDSSGSGCQVRVSRPLQPPLTKYFAYAKNGGKENAWRLAKIEEKRLQHIVELEVAYERKTTVRVTSAPVTSAPKNNRSNADPDRIEAGNSRIAGVDVQGLTVYFIAQVGMVFNLDWLGSNGRMQNSRVIAEEHPTPWDAIDAVIRPMAEDLDVPAPFARYVWRHLWRTQRSKLFRICPICKRPWQQDTDATRRNKFCSYSCAGVMRRGGAQCEK